MKAMIIGAGAQGAAAAAILARDESVEKIILGDLNEKMVTQVAEKINSDKLEHVVVDANDVDKVAEYAKAADVIIDFAMPWLVPKVMEAAIKAKVHYVNSAFDTPFWDELAEGKPLSYHEEFVKIGKTAIMGCGATPGMSNVYVRKYVDKLDTVENIFINCTLKGPQELSKARPWFPGWSPRQAMIDFATEPMIFENGKYKKMPIFSGEEEFDFKEPINKGWIAYHSHEEAYSIPHVFKEKGLVNSNFKFILDEQAATFVKMGFVPENEIIVNGQKVKPLDVLVEMTEKTSDVFTGEKRPVNDFDPMPTTLFLIIKGKKDGKDVTYNVLLPALNAKRQQVYDIFGTTIIIVALPAITGAKMCIEGVKKGLVFSEELDPNRFIELMTEKIDYKEQLF